MLPTDVLRVGDWLRWENMGAYTICAASQVSRPASPCCLRMNLPAHTPCSHSQFNGFRCSEVRYTIDTRGAVDVEEAIRRLLLV